MISSIVASGPRDRAARSASPPPASRYSSIVVIGVGALAGTLGALLGVGGGVFLVPFLNAALGLPFNVASGVGLMSVIATSSVVSAATAGRRPVNLRLGMVLQIASSAGGLTGGVYAAHLSHRTLYAMFAAVTAAISAIRQDAHRAR